MAHTHSHSTQDGLTLAFWLNLFFSIIELIGGILTNSTAIIADAFHDFMDAFAIAVAVILEKISNKERTQKFTYGYRRFSLLSAIGISVILLVGAILMAVAALRSFLNPEAVNGIGMLWLALLGIGVNGFAVIKIKNSNGHTHSQTDNYADNHHQHEHGHGSGENYNSRAIMLHLMEDLLGWVAVLVGAVIISFTHWYWIDGVLAMGIAGFIGYNATRNLINTVTVMLQSVPAHIDTEKLIEELYKVDGVVDIHDFHVWSVDGQYNIGSLHVVVNNIEDGQYNRTITDLTQIITQYHIHHPTIQLETADAECQLTHC